MKKLLLPLVIMLLVLAAYGNQDEKNNKAKTRSYKMDDGKTVDIPKDPKRITVVAPTYAGGFKKLGIDIVAVNQRVDRGKVLKDRFKGVTRIGDGGVEKVAKEKPDLIIVYSTDKDIKKYQKVTPTVVVDCNKHKYLEQQEMLGKAVSRGDKVKAWKKDWEETTAKDGKEVKKVIGQDATVSLFDGFDKKLYTYGGNQGRGGEVLYQAFGLKVQPERQKSTAKAGWAEMKQEEIEGYANDYIVSTSRDKLTPGYESTSMWRNLKAAEEGHAVRVGADTYWYNGSYTLDLVRRGLEEKLIKAAK